jgi:outer membrane lipoprotein carrier protein
MTTLLTSLALLLTLASASAPARAQTVDATLDRAVAAYAKVKTVRANMEQTLTNPLTGSTFKSKGQIQQRRPNRLEIRYTEPKGDRIVADGKFVWVYTPSTNPGQAFKLPLGAGGAGSTDLMAELFTNPRSRFTISGAGLRTEGKRTIHGLTLVPRVDAPTPVDFVKAIVWVDTNDGIIREFEITDASGVVRNVKLSAVKLNATIPSSAFVFSVPKGVQVFEQP